MALALALLLQTLPPLTLGEALQLPPEIAGERVLQGRAHRPIVSVTKVMPVGMIPPGVWDAYLVERPEQVGAHCERRRWTAAFRYKGNGPPETGVLDTIYPMTEIALPVGQACPTGDFIHLNPNVSADEATVALVQLRQVAGGRFRITSCKDETRSRLCASDRKIRRELRELPAWVVSRIDGLYEFWLSRPGQAVTSVRLDLRKDGRVDVRRSIPAPF